MAKKTFISHLFTAVLLLFCVACEKPFTEESDSGSGDTGDTDEIVITDKDKKDTESVNVQFNVIGVESQLTGSAPLANACKRLSLSVFDADGERCNYKTITQKHTDSDFGKMLLSVPKGKYTFVFVAENGAEAPTLSKLDAVKFSKNKLTDTYLYCGEYDIKASASYDIALKNITATVKLVVNDVTPSDIDSLTVYYTGGSSTLDASTGYGSVNSRQTEVRAVDMAAYNGKSGYYLYTFPHEDASTLTLKVTARAGNKEIYMRTVGNVGVERDNTTECVLDLFGENPEQGR